MSRLATKVLIAVLAVAASPVGAAPAGAIVGGLPDGDAHPNVGLLGLDVDGTGPAAPFALCTGSVISDRAFLTAAHCVAADPGAAWVVSLDGGRADHPVATPGFFPDDFPFAITAPVRRATGAAVHPDFGAGESRENDVAVVRFPAGTFSGVAPVALPPLGLLDREPEGLPITLAGYGTDATLGPPRHFFAGYRRTATAALQAVTPRWLRVAPGPAALCYGDSGSPQLLEGMAVSLLSHHATTCEGSSRAQRLDTESIRSFVMAQR
jgi:hypothetical protein